MSEPTPDVVSWHIPRLILTWGLVAVGTVSVVLWTPVEMRFEWLAIMLGLTIITSFVIQLGTAQREGFIARLSYSVAGGALIIGLVELVAFLLGSR